MKDPKEGAGKIIVRVRAAVMIDADGNYGVCGWRPEESWDRREADRRMMDEAEMIGEFEDEGRIVVRGWLEGEFAMPETQTVEGGVEHWKARAS